MSTSGSITPVGGLNWLPNLTPTAGPTPYGFLDQTLDRGQFRNDTPELTVGKASASVFTTSLGAVTSPSGSQDWPILAAFRPLENPSVVIGAAPTQPYISTSSGTGTSADNCGLIITFGTYLSPSSAAISCMKITYSLVVNINDPTLPKYLTAADALSLKHYLAGTTTTLSINWAQYPFGCIKTIDSTGTSKTWTSTVTAANSSRSSGDQSTTQDSFIVTGYVSTAVATPTVNTYTQYFATPTVAGPNIKSILIENTFNVSFLTYYIYNIMLFNNSACNFPIKPSPMLPCSYFQYAYYASFQYDPSDSQISYPTYGNRPNLHVKIFSPEERVAVTGLAHNIFLNFVILSFPFSIGEFGTLYEVQFSGLAASPQTWQLIQIDTSVAQGQSGRVIPMDYTPIPNNTASLLLQKVTNGGSTAPTDAANWVTLDKSSLQLSALPTSFSVSGPWVSPYLYLDPAGITKDWYRVIQTFTNGSNYTSGAFQSQTYTEQNAFELLNSENGVSSTSELITRRVMLPAYFPQSNPLQALSPLVTFLSQVQTPLSSPVNFGMGEWSLTFRAYVSDQNSLTDTHIFARFWFQPVSNNYDPGNPYEYRKQTEFYFTTNPTTQKSTLVFGTPTNLNQCLVSMPLPNTGLTTIQISRNVDSVQGLSSSGYTLPFGTNIQAQVVCALYSVSYPYNGAIVANLSPYPTVNIEINPLYGTLETTILQYLSNTITPVNSAIYTDSYYNPVATPLNATYNLVGGTSNAPTTPGYVSYTQAFSTRPTGSNVATSNLMSLGIDTAAKFYIPYTSIPLTEFNTSGAVYADFATNGTILDLGMVMAGTWDFTFSVNASVDTSLIGCDYKLDGFLVAANGTVVDYVFRTDFITGISSSAIGSVSITATATTSITYEINGGESVQFVLRLWAYPYSIGGNSVDVATIKTNLSKQTGKPQFGARIDSFVINATTLNTLKINQIASQQGSPSWFEDLPLVPPNTFDSSQFTFSSDPSLSSSQFLSAGAIEYVPGTLYSPVWSGLNWPADMEISVAGGGFDTTDQTIWLRTVPSKSTSSTTEFGVTATENPLHSPDVHVAYGVPNNTVTSLSYDVEALALTSSAVNHYILQNPFQTPVGNALIAGQNNGSTFIMEGKNPSFSFLKQGAGGKNYPGSMLAVVVEVDEQTTTSFSVNINQVNGSENVWENPIPDGTFGSLHRLVEGLTFPCVVQSNTSNLMYIAGYCSGAVFLKEVNVYDVGNDSALVPGQMYLVDGSASAAPGGNQTFIISTTLNGTAVQTFPSVLVDQSGRVWCAYTLVEYPGCIFAKISYTGQSFDGQAYNLVNLPQIGISASSTVMCYGITMTMHQSTQTAYMAFWCAGKVFVTAVNTNPTTGLSVLDQIILVCGDIDFSNNSNPVNASFAILQSKNTLRVDRTDTETDIPSQRVGIYASAHWPDQGNIFIYYVNSNQQLCVRSVQIGGTTSAPYVYPVSGS